MALKVECTWLKSEYTWFVVGCLGAGTRIWPLRQMTMLSPSSAGAAEKMTRWQTCLILSKKRKNKGTLKSIVNERLIHFIIYIFFFYNRKRSWNVLFCTFSRLMATLMSCLCTYTFVTVPFFGQFCFLFGCSLLSSFSSSCLNTLKCCIITEGESILFDAWFVRWSLLSVLQHLC